MNMGTERSQLHHEPQTLQMEEQRAARNHSHPSGSEAVYNFHQVSWHAQKSPPIAKAGLSFHLVKCQLQFTLMIKPVIFQFQKEITPENQQERDSQENPTGLLKFQVQGKNNNYLLNQHSLGVMI